IIAATATSSSGSRVAIGGSLDGSQQFGCLGRKVLSAPQQLADRRVGGGGEGAALLCVQGSPLVIVTGLEQCTPR
ncbi:MAG TPA: hypothetical protein VMS02_06375, partial [Solirubrobacteraceae bacterium]|nr:hypothetical protein [Solirubrobacteraceae bacterium]